ncbi:hypothetical protein [Brucella intermedia]|uniref:hypothetical protein n=1 Tax=Brucella intermedia TaxID=94625 RepID=UPI00224A4921|nr:hypothetical protein [Brucella intermedia]
MFPVCVVQSFTASRWGVVPDVPIQVGDVEQAERLAERLAHKKPAVLAVYKWNNKAEVITAIGDVPDSFLDAIACG